MNILLSSIFFLVTQTAIPSKLPPKSVAPKEAKAALHTSENARSVMIIDPKSRATDYQEAFNLLKGEKSSAKVVFELADGQKISNVIDMKMMPNNTVVVFRYGTAQGVMFQAVEIENIVSIILE